jgi:hypothetical protein
VINVARSALPQVMPNPAVEGTSNGEVYLRFFSTAVPPLAAATP